MPNLNELLIFAKFPAPGKVKTRLAKQIGAEEACKAYKLMVETVLKKVKPASETYKCTLYFDPPKMRESFEKWLPYPTSKRPQSGGNLGKRMVDGIQESLALGSEKVLVIGSDCIEINREIIEHAFHSLETKDVVIGPASDGGYYLIGMKKPYPSLFEDISWSSETVLQESLDKANELNLSVSLLPVLRDIDQLDPRVAHE